jgi:uncharacterized YccA/Bax inhibitor family protein
VGLVVVIVAIHLALVWHPRVIQFVAILEAVVLGVMAVILDHLARQVGKMGEKVVQLLVHQATMGHLVTPVMLILHHLALLIVLQLPLLQVTLLQ